MILLFGVALQPNLSLFEVSIFMKLEDFSKLSYEPFDKDIEREKLTQLYTMTFARDIFILMSEPGLKFLEDTINNLNNINLIVINKTKYYNISKMSKDDLTDDLNADNPKKISNEKIYETVKLLHSYCQIIAENFDNYIKSHDIKNDTDFCIDLSQMLSDIMTLPIPVEFQDFNKKWNFKEDSYFTIIKNLLSLRTKHEDNNDNVSSPIILTSTITKLAESIV
ncbi:MAG: hypothetical protein LBD17_02750, partial [Endomicrobium sp.]|nr:hypothetical protein [Endomicrobium sp.]